MKLRSLVLAFNGMMIVGSLAGVVLADDVTNSPASACVPDGSGQLVVTAAGGVANQTASTVTAMCPVERKSTNGTFSSTFSGRVWVLDRSPTTNVCCRVVSSNPSGTKVLGTSVCSSGTSTSNQSLVLPEITDSTSYSHFYISCTVPAQASGNASGLATFRAIQQ